MAKDTSLARSWTPTVVSASELTIKGAEKYVEKSLVKDIAITGIFDSDKRQLRMYLQNTRPKDVLVRLEWTVFENVQIVYGSEGKAFVPAGQTVCYGILSVRHKSKKWSYRYMMYLTEDAEPVDPQVEVEKNKLDLSEGYKKFNELKLDVKSMTSDAIIAACEAKGVKFIDMEFPPVERSIYPDRVRTSEQENLTWRRASEFLGSTALELFDSTIEPADVKQGKISDSWFVCALAALAEQPDLVQRLFVTKKVNKAGLYHLRIFQTGRLTDVIVDDLFPCFPDGGPAFSRNHGSELWVMLLEKAYAKLHGCYWQLRDGWATEAMQDLTGSPADTFHFNRNSIRDEINGGDFWKKMLNWKKLNHLMSTETLDTVNQTDTGLVPKHFYTILDVQEWNGNKLIKLRNPWGCYEWKGKWSDYSSLWTDEAKLRLQMHGEQKDDGLFWMSFQDYIIQFKNLCVCYWRNDWQEQRLPGSFKASPSTGKMMNEVFQVQVPKATTLFLAVHQVDLRVLDAPYPYFSLGLLLMSKDAKQVLADSGVKPFRVAQVEAKVEKGEYLIFPYTLGKTESSKAKDMYQRPFTVSIHSLVPVKVNVVPHSEQVNQTVEQAFVENCKRFGKKVVCRRGLVIWEWAGKKRAYNVFNQHFCLAAELTHEWHKGPIRFSCSIKVFDNFRLANGTASSVVLSMKPTSHAPQPKSSAFLNMGVVADENQAWKYHYEWSFVDLD